LLELGSIRVPATSLRRSRQESRRPPAPGRRLSKFHPGWRRLGRHVRHLEDKIADVSLRPAGVSAEACRSSPVAVRPVTWAFKIGVADGGKPSTGRKVTPLATILTHGAVVRDRRAFSARGCEPASSRQSPMRWSDPRSTRLDPPIREPPDDQGWPHPLQRGMPTSAFPRTERQARRLLGIGRRCRFRRLYLAIADVGLASTTRVLFGVRSAGQWRCD